ncbi:putative two-component sensor kinase [Bacillus sp. J14TS2]|uniref:cache domain-containing sensor histidine kinase n=1 Tax=Bacillus sp. J14TS2 TaxID=2807188 RepID=UPI001B2C1AF8|nr:sensor histidine kinase [Bacillus sp. J14TS2]GIN69721.1 putative two-component sensor kinase [Bacillus sp. J14TS2]
MFTRLIKRGFQKFGHLSLRNKLIVVYLTLFLVPVVLIVFIYSQQIYKNAIKESERNHQYELEMEKIHINKNIESMRESAQILASDQDIIDFVSVPGDKAVEQLLDFQRNQMMKMGKLLNVNPSIESSHFFVDDEALNEMWPILFRENRIEHLPWFKEAMSRDEIELWKLQSEDSQLLTNRKEKNPKIALYRKVNDIHGNHLGIVEISMFQKNFFPKMYSPIQDEQSEIILVNQQQQIFSNPARTFLKDHPFTEKDYQYILDHLKQDEEIHSLLFTIEKIPYLAVSTFIPSIDTFMINIVSLEDLHSETKRVRISTILLAAALLSVLFLLTYLMISLLLKKMYKLIDKMKQVEKGDFTTNIDVEGDDEFAALAFHFRSMLEKINQLIAEAVYKQAITKDTELKALKTQIDSHFLYNTLENIKMMAEIEGKYDISDSLTSLGEMMRYNIKWKNEFVVLREEIAHIQNYIEIMNLRLDHPIHFVMDIPTKLENQEILKLSLQPIVENAIKHGLQPDFNNKQPCLKLRVYEENDQLLMIEIKDNGVGMDEQVLDSLSRSLQLEGEPEAVSHKNGSGIGLKNVQERVLLSYGKEYGIQVESEKNIYTKVILKLPFFIIRRNFNQWGN